MDEGENQEIAAALAKLAERDAGAADDAGAALEWIGADQGLGPCHPAACPELLLVPAAHEMADQPR
jgi:hypothetical protein